MAQPIQANVDIPLLSKCEIIRFIFCFSHGGRKTMANRLKFSQVATTYVSSFPDEINMASNTYSLANQFH